MKRAVSNTIIIIGLVFFVFSVFFILLSTYQHYRIRENYPQSVLPSKYEHTTLRDVPVGDVIIVSDYAINVDRDGLMWAQGMMGASNLTNSTYGNRVTLRRTESGFELLESTIGTARWQRSRNRNMSPPLFLPVEIVEEFGRPNKIPICEKGYEIPWIC